MGSRQAEFGLQKRQQLEWSRSSLVVFAFLTRSQLLNSATYRTPSKDTVLDISSFRLETWIETGQQ